MNESFRSIWSTGSTDSMKKPVSKDDPRSDIPFSLISPPRRGKKDVNILSIQWFKFQSVPYQKKYSMASDDVQKHLNHFCRQIYLSFWNMTDSFLILFHCMERGSQDILQKFTSVFHKRNKFGFWTTWGWVNDDSIFTFRVNYPFNPQNRRQNIVLNTA